MMAAMRKSISFNFGTDYMHSLAMLNILTVIIKM